MSEARLREIDGNLELVEDGKVRKRWKRGKRGKPKEGAQPIGGETSPEHLEGVQLHRATMSNGDRVMIPVGINLDSLPREVHPFGEVWAEKICQGISEGHSLTHLCKQEGWPGIHVVYRWLRKYPEFQSEFTEARKMQADWAYDKVLQIAESPDDDVKAARLKADIYKWAAEVNDRRQYQSTTRLEQEIPKVNITIVTGVPDPDPVEVPSWDPKDDPEWQQQAKESPLFCQATSVKEP